jgi:hypothetical protein
MTIAIDFDDTYTADPVLWDQFIAAAIERGHKVYCVTCRRDNEDNRDIVRIGCLPKHRHLFTGLSPKRWFCEQRGITVDIWVDDCPECVKEGR